MNPNNEAVGLSENLKKPVKSRLFADYQRLNP